MPGSQDFKDFIKEYAEELRHSDAWKADGGGESQNLLNERTERYAEGGQLKFYRAVGCDKCNKTGYKGCIGLHELMIADDAAKTDSGTCQSCRAPCIRCYQRHAHLKNGWDGKGLDGIDRFKDGLVGMH